MVWSCRRDCHGVAADPGLKVNGHTVVGDGGIDCAVVVESGVFVYEGRRSKGEHEKLKP
jgi:hypothetical protein